MIFNLLFYTISLSFEMQDLKYKQKIVTPIRQSFLSNLQTRRIKKNEGRNDLNLRIMESVRLVTLLPCS